MSSPQAKSNKEKNRCDNFVKTVYEVSSNRIEIENLSEIAVSTVEKIGVMTDFHHLRLVLMEALTNALLYGNLEITSGIREAKGEDFFWQLVGEREKDVNFFTRKIVLQIECVEDELRFTVRDEGEGFDWRNYLESINTGDKEMFHARGIFLIQNYADELRWNDKGNEIMFTIKLGPQSLGRREQENGAKTGKDQ